MCLLSHKELMLLGSRKDYLVLGKKLGVVRMSMAVEGAGERVRNQYLNKNLPRKLWMQAVRNCFEERLIALKFTMILTGKETAEDWEDFYDELEEVYRIRRETGANTSIGLTFTPLVVYDTAPLRYEERHSAYTSFYNIKSSSEAIKRMKEIGVKVRFNGRGASSFIEQFNLDAGPRATALLIDLALKTRIGSMAMVSYVELEKFKALAEEHNIDYASIFPARNPDKPLPSDVFKLNEKKVMDTWREMFRTGNYQKEVCLKTPAHLKGHCTACGLCETPEQINAIVNRSLDNKNTIDEVIETDRVS